MKIKTDTVSSNCLAPWGEGGDISHKYHDSYLPLFPLGLPVCQALCYAQRPRGPERGEGLPKVAGRGVRLATFQSLYSFQNTQTGWRLLGMGSLQSVGKRGSGFFQIPSPSWPVSDG